MDKVVSISGLSGYSNTRTYREISSTQLEALESSETQTTIPAVADVFAEALRELDEQRMVGDNKLQVLAQRDPEMRYNVYAVAPQKPVILAEQKQSRFDFYA